jgi:uncharacterized membrane protein
MTFCPTCGGEVGGRFCAHCGATIGTADVAPKLASALCYFPLLAIMFLLLPPYSKNREVRFHAFQCFGLVAAISVLGIGLGVLIVVLEELAPSMSDTIEILTGSVTLLALMVFPIAATMAFCEKRLNVPLIGWVAQKLAC